MDAVKKGLLAFGAFFMALLLLLIVWFVGVDQDEQSTSTGDGTSSAQLKPGSVPAQYQAWVIEAGSMCPEVPAPYIAAQIEQESGWNPNAVSPSGAQGLSQFMPGTWPSYGTGSPFDPHQAILAQGKFDCTIARDMKPRIASGQVHGDLLDVISWSYNAGEGAVLANGGQPPYAETIAYAKSIKAKMAKYTAPGASFGGGGGGRYQYQPGIAWGEQAVAAAMKWLGTTYSWGGGDYNGPTKGIHDGGVADSYGDYNKVGFDCSGLTMYAWYQGSNGAVKLSHLTYSQNDEGVPIPMNALQKGDLILLNGDEHVAMYVGDGKMIEAPESGDVVKISPLRGGHAVRPKAAAGQAAA